MSRPNLTDLQEDAEEASQILTHTRAASPVLDCRRVALARIHREPQQDKIHAKVHPC